MCFIVGGTMMGNPPAEARRAGGIGLQTGAPARRCLQPDGSALSQVASNHKLEICNEDDTDKNEDGRD